MSSYSYRIKSRLKDDGVLSTLRYLILASCYTIQKSIIELFLDLKYSHKLLIGNLKTPYKHLGANDTYHTDYSVMPYIFNMLKITADDILVDVGCGKGRVINYWLSRKLKNTIYGLELNPVIAANTKAQFATRNNIFILCGDAVQNLPQNGTVYYFYNPFSEEKVREFEDKLRSFPQDNIRVVYYNPKSAHVFDKTHWDVRQINFERDFGLRQWGRMNRYHELCIITKKCATQADSNK